MNVSLMFIFSQTSLSGNLQFVVPRNFFEHFCVISMVCLHVEHGK